MAYENDKYYLYCTGHGVAQMTSTDRQHWTLNPQGVLKDEARGVFRHRRMIVCRAMKVIPGHRMSSGIRISGIWLIPVLPSARIPLPSDC